MVSDQLGGLVVSTASTFLLLCVISYLYHQTRESFFRIFQAGWAAFCVLDLVLIYRFFGGASSAEQFLAKMLGFLTLYAIFASLRVAEGEIPFRFHRYDLAIVGPALLFLINDVWVQGASNEFAVAISRISLLRVMCAGLLLFSGIQFSRLGKHRDSLGYRSLGIALGIWSAITAVVAFRDVAEAMGSLELLVELFPQLLIAVSLVSISFENERRKVQENSIFFSTLDIDRTSLVSGAELEPSLQRILERLVRLFESKQASLLVGAHWRRMLPSVCQEMPTEFATEMETSGVSEYLIDLTYRRGGLVALPKIATALEPIPAGQPGRFDRLREISRQFGISGLTAISLQTREKNFGVIVLPDGSIPSFGPAQIRLLLGLAMQIAMTLENHVAMQETQRRTREYELLTQMGQVVSSRLNTDDILLAIHKEIGLLVDTNNFSVAFVEGDNLRFDLEVRSGEVRPKRSQVLGSGLSEFVVRTAQPLLIKSDMEQITGRLGIAGPTSQLPKSYCGVPIFMSGHSSGIMAAMSFDRESAYTERDVELMQTAAGQVAVAVENARLFEEQQRRARYLTFLNNISKTAISSDDAEQMLAEIVSEMKRTFPLDHIAIGMLDYASKEIEIKAETGAESKLGRRIPLGSGTMGRVARTNEMVLAQAPTESNVNGMLADAKSVLCLPLTYGDTLLGVLDVESKRENAFAEQDVLILRTLADLLATAMHNAFVFQKLQQQSITDGLTGIKTRRFYLESLQNEWRRASRAGRPFSVVMIDLDKFKEVNDAMGHLEGDLVLARVGRLLEQKCRQSNVVARYGGDEFVILMPETGIEQAQILSERLRLWIATDPMLNDRHITGSFGVASFPLHGSTVEDVMRVADAGMYVSKHAGGNRVSTAEEFQEGETIALQRQLVASHIEGFLQREDTGPESAQELIDTLHKMCDLLKGDPEPMREAVLALSRAAEAREAEGEGHGIAVSRYVDAMARRMGLAKDEISELSYAALVHDVGKILVPEKMLSKPGPLTEDEYFVVKMHPTVAAEIVGAIPDSQNLQEMIKHHHERVDGRGYPDGLVGAQIPLGARILSVADAYISMVRDRPFSTARTSTEAIDELQRMAGSQFDSSIVSVFVDVVLGRESISRFVSPG